MKDAKTAPSAPHERPRVQDLEIKDPAIIFSAIWEKLELQYGRENLRFPKEIILLGGAPGAGKGTQTQFISRARGLTFEPIVVSSLLSSEEANRIKAAGGMVGDKEVIDIVFRTLLKPEYRDGVILDGFPRTKTQVECFKLLIQKIGQLRTQFFDTPLGMHFRKPIVHIMVLFVDERTSVERQLRRGQEIFEHNEKVRESGVGTEIELRPTDLSEDAARHRYRVFKEHTWDALQSLKEHFHYHFVNANGPIREVEENLLQEMQYQSSLELDPKTFDRMRRLPAAADIVVRARQELVRRLDGYEYEHPAVFEQVIELADKKVMPIVMRHAISGRAIVNSEDPILDSPLALAMLIDLFSERGFHATVDIQRHETPVSVDLKTGAIQVTHRKVYRIHIHFRGSQIRRG